MNILLYLIAFILLVYIVQHLVRTRKFAVGDAIAILGLIVSLLVAQTQAIDLSGISQFFQLQLTLGQVLIGVCALAIVGALGFFAFWRYKNKKQRMSITAGKKYFEAKWDSVLWEIDNS